MKDYIEQAMRTAADTTHPVNIHLLHAAMGMVTETVEMEQAENETHFQEEAGDVLWYLALACNHLSVTFEEAEEQGGRDHSSPVAIAAAFLDLMKKQMFYGKGVPVEQMVALIGGLILSIRASVPSLDLLMEQNIAKLQLRYPEKFSEDRAINR